MSHAGAAPSSWQGTRMAGAGRSHRRHPAVHSVYGQDARSCEQNVEALWRKKKCPGKGSLNGTPPVCHDDTPPGGGRYEAFAHTCHASVGGVR